MPLSPGTRVGAYEIRGVLGEGGMGEVYAAYDSRLGREVAVKVVRHLEGVDRAELVGRFQREARAVGRLRHSGIVAVHDVGEHEGLPYLVMERLEGETLRARLARGPLSVEEALGWFRQACGAFAAAHAAGLVHRDIKPENLFLASDGQLKVLDFGLAKDTRPAGQDQSTQLATRTGTVLGTLGYLSPEQARGEAVDARADVFALGAVLLELLTGRPAFARDTPVATLSAILTEDPLATAAVPAELKPLLSACLAKDPAHRLEDAGAILRSLAHGPSAARPSRSRRPLFAAAGVAALLAVGGGGMAWVRRGHPVPPSATTKSPGWEALEAARYLQQHTPMKDLEGKSLAEDPVARAFQAALAKDPALAAANLGLARHLVNRVFLDRNPRNRPDLAPAAYVALSRVLAGDPGNVEALVLRSNLSFTPDAGWRMDDALADVLAAIRQDRHDPTALGFFVNLCDHLGFPEEGLPAVEEILRKEPGKRELLLGRARLEAQALSSGVEVAFQEVPPDLRTDWVTVLVRLGRVPEARAYLSKYRDTWWINPADPGVAYTADFDVLALEALLAAREGRPAESLRFAVDAEQRGRDLSFFHHSAYTLACAHAAVGRTGEALRLLRFCAEHGYPCYAAFERDPLLDPLRADPGFQAFLDAQRFEAKARRKRIAAVLR